jgi:hypothetical protein
MVSNEESCNLAAMMDLEQILDMKKDENQVVKDNL